MLGGEHTIYDLCRNENFKGFKIMSHVKLREGINCWIEMHSRKVHHDFERG